MVFRGGLGARSPRFARCLVERRLVSIAAGPPRDRLAGGCTTPAQDCLLIQGQPRVGSSLLLLTRSCTDHRSSSGLPLTSGDGSFGRTATLATCPRNRSRRSAALAPQCSACSIEPRRCRRT
jgi:hypothetical protein